MAKNLAQWGREEKMIHKTFYYIVYTVLELDYSAFRAWSKASEVKGSLSTDFQWTFMVKYLDLLLLMEVVMLVGWI